jgi:hypothetical protein
MSNFQLLSQEKKDELCQLLPDIDLRHQSASSSSNYSQLDHLNHDSYDYNNHNNNNSSHPTFLTSKNENPIFWNTLSDWQTMLGQGEYYLSHPPLPLSPPTTTTTNNSSSNKSTSTTSTLNNNNNNRQKSTKSNSKKDKFKDEGFESYWGELIDKERAHNVAG